MRKYAKIFCSHDNGKKQIQAPSFSDAFLIEQANRYDENGILFTNIYNFLLRKDSIL